MSTNLSYIEQTGWADINEIIRLGQYARDCYSFMYINTYPIFGLYFYIIAVERMNVSPAFYKYVYDD